MQLFCLDCGLEVFSQATCCCTQRVRDNLSAYRVHSPAVNLPQGEFYCIRWALGYCSIGLPLHRFRLPSICAKWLARLPRDFFSAMRPGSVG